MFGYITVNKPEMKFKEFAVYHSYYCGLCQVLKKKYGAAGQMSLSYDMTFLVMLLTGLYEPKEKRGLTRCIAHPLEKHPTTINQFTEYAADMNLLLTYYKCEDDWKDEKKLLRHVYAQILDGKYKKVQSYREKAEKIKKLLESLSLDEQKNITDLDRMAGHFGEIMAEVFAYRQDEWEVSLRRMGFYLGKFIYLLDAYEDVEEDIKKNHYNPLKERYEEAKREKSQKAFETSCAELLTMMIAECSREFEKLPILENVEILRNILYSGVWYRYELVKEKRKNQKNKTGD